MITLAEEYANRPPLTPHRYPVWIIAFFIVLCWAEVYSLTFVPVYIRAWSDLQSGERAYQIHGYDKAIFFYGQVLNSLPSSEEAKISMAEACFATQDPQRQKQAMHYLNGVTLDSDQWKRLKAVMPKEYQAHFKSMDNP